ncbi:MAG: hypothetical protein L0Y72_03545 [Gemmataceae bacterium]|nr:hypothetical protein [Gemmataceae bacterium]
MKQLTVSALVFFLGFGIAKGQDSDPVRAKLELARQKMFLEISKRGASFTEQSENAERARKQGLAEIDQILNGSPKPTPVSEKKKQLVGKWRGTAKQTDGGVTQFEMSVNAHDIIVNTITVVTAKGTVASRRVFRGQLEYYKDGVVYLTALNGLSQQFSRLEWSDETHFTLTTAGSPVSKYERVK